MDMYVDELEGLLKKDPLHLLKNDAPEGSTRFEFDLLSERKRKIILREDGKDTTNHPYNDVSIIVYSAKADEGEKLGDDPFKEKEANEHLKELKNNIPKKHRKFSLDNKVSLLEYTIELEPWRKSKKIKDRILIYRMLDFLYDSFQIPSQHQLGRGIIDQLHGLDVPFYAFVQRSSWKKPRLVYINYQKNNNPAYNHDPGYLNIMMLIPKRLRQNM